MRNIFFLRSVKIALSGKSQKNIKKALSGNQFHDQPSAYSPLKKKICVIYICFFFLRVIHFLLFSAFREFPCIYTTNNNFVFFFLITSCPVVKHEKNTAWGLNISEKRGIAKL